MTDIRALGRTAVAALAGLGAALLAIGGTDALVAELLGPARPGAHAPDSGTGDATVRVLMLAYSALACWLGGWLARRIAGRGRAVVAVAAGLGLLTLMYVLAVPEDGPLWYRVAGPIVAAAAALAGGGWPRRRRLVPCTAAPTASER